MYINSGVVIWKTAGSVVSKAFTGWVNSRIKNALDANVGLLIVPFLRVWF